MTILAIESSCDETSMSVIKDGTTDLGTVILSQIDIHKLYGGVVPEIASRSHVESITIVLEEVLNKASITIEDIDAIAVTYGPGLIGSLLVGLLVAIIEWIITKDFQTAILLSGILAGGTYDVFHNMEKIVKKEV